MIQEIETHNLEAHVSICQERYMALERRFENVEQRIEKIETMVSDIHREIHNIAQKNHAKWDRTQIAIIGGLIGLVTYLVSHVLGT
jgi:predicted  nucleic acid-binding Zn-ribbon protein